LILRVAHANDLGKSSPFPETGTQDQADNSRRSEQNNATDNTIPPREKMSMPVSYQGVRHIYGSSFTLPPDIPRSLPIDYSADYIAMR